MGPKLLFFPEVSVFYKYLLLPVIMSG